MKSKIYKYAAACIMQCICLIILNPAAAQTVLFNFDNVAASTPLPITITQSGITAHFTTTGQGYSIQNANVLGFTPKGFSGNCIYPGSVYLTDLYINFDQTITYFSILYACQELACDDAATMRVTAYIKGSYVGTNTKTAAHPGTWPSDSLTCSFPKGFDSVVLHYDKRPPTCQDYGVIFMTDNMRVATIACVPPTAQQAAISAGGPATFCKGSNVVLSVATPGLNYQWKKGTTNISGAILQSYTAVTSGSYKCLVSNNCGSITSNSIQVTVNPLPVVTVLQDPCTAGSVLLHANTNPATGVTYQWARGTKIITGATNATYSATTSGTYKCSVTVTATGCSKISAAASVTISCLQAKAADQSQVLVHPNPSSDYFSINTAKLDPRSMIYIYDLAGTLYETHAVTGGEIQVGGLLSKGVYVLKVVVNNETKQIIKLVKNF